MRTITLYTTLGKLIKIETEATTWGELRPLANEEGVDTTQMRAMENKNKTSLEHDDAVLPEGNFTIFFTKINSKAGAEMSYKELRANIKELVDTQDAAEHFNEGRNYTNKSKKDLQELYDSYSAQETEEETEQRTAPLEVSVFNVTVGEALNALATYFEEEDPDCFITENLDEYIESEACGHMEEDLTPYFTSRGTVEPVLSFEERARLVAQRQEEEEERARLDQEARSLGLV